jgi:hypothetical protein
MRSGQVNWTVSAAQQTTSQDATGRFTKGWEVSYTLDTGHVGTVFVPGDILNQEQVKAAINQSAAALYGVVNLTSGY